MARRRVFADRVEGGRALIEGDGAHHLHHVLRVKPGQTFEVSDLHQVWLGRVLTADARRVVLALEEPLAASPPLPDVTLMACIFKFDRYEWMLEKATELGVARVTPVISERTDPRLARAAAGRVERWRRIAWEAAQQSRRLAPPVVDDPSPLSFATAQAAAGVRWMLDESLAGDPRPSLPAPETRSTVLAGPEGGFTDRERKEAAAAGFAAVSLGPLILRAETAAIAALAVLIHLHVSTVPVTMKRVDL